MHLRRTLSAACLVLAATTAPAWSIVIEQNKQLIAGYVVREDARQVTVRVPVPGGKDREQTFELSKVKVITKVDRARLAKLGTDVPADYRDYAEELAARRSDPEAVDVAMRLFLIAAYLDPEKLGRSCLLQMAKLAADPADARKYQAMAYLLDPREDPTLLTELARTVPAPGTDVAALHRFRLALKQYRNGEFKLAGDNARVKGVEPYFAKSGFMDHRRFVRASDEPTPCEACRGKGKQKCTTCEGTGASPHPEDHLKAILKAEMWAIEQVVATGQARRPGAGGWSRGVDDRPSAATLLRLETISEHDPRKCVFRDGEWVAP